MDYFSSINSTNNVTKAVMSLPKNLRTSYYKSSDDANFNENNILKTTTKKQFNFI